MNFKASRRYASIAPRKVRPVADLIRGLPVNEAMEALRYNRMRGAYFVDGVLRSAMANASEDGRVDVDSLYVKEVCVDEGPTRKRLRLRARGMAFVVRKRTAHITIVLDEMESE